MQIKDICKGVTHLPLPLMRVKGRVKVVTTFDIAFDSNQRYSKAITYLISTLTRVKGRSKMLIHLTSPLIRIKGICKGVTSLTYYLMRIKCGVKAVITFDHTFDTNQRMSKSIFSCSEWTLDTDVLGKVTKFGGHSFNRLEVTNLQSWHSSIMFVSAPLSGSIVVSMSFMRIVQVFWMPWLTLWIFRWWMKHSSNHNREKKIKRQLDELDDIICNNFQHPDIDKILDKYSELKNEFESIYEQKGKAAMFRSKSRWLEEGERPTKYFFNLEKRNYNKKTVTELNIDDDTTVKDEKKILYQIESFYEELYSTEMTFSHTDYDEFIKDLKITRLSKDARETCEGLLTFEECKKSLETFQNENLREKTDLQLNFTYSFLNYWDKTSLPV